MKRPPLFCIVLLYGTINIFPVLPAPAASERPNLVFLLTDDQRDNTLGAMGHPLVQTPHLDRLLKKSVRFTNTYIAEPVCASSRASLFTGVYERVHGIGFTSSYRLSEEQWNHCYPSLLRRNGYYTGFVGKFGLEYYTFRGRAADMFDFWRAHDGWASFFHRSATNCRIYDDSPHDLITPTMGDSMARFLDTAPADRPFCLSVSFNVPHGSQTTSMYTGYKQWTHMLQPANENPRLRGHPIYDMLYREQSIAIPPATGTDPYRYIPQFIMDQDQGRRNRTYPYSYTVPTGTEHHIRYYQTLTGLDRVIGDLVKDLERRNLIDNTVILFASDHGLLMGEYGMGGKALLYDLASKIPCFVYDPRLPEDRRGHSEDALVSSLDLTRTLLDYGGVAAPKWMQGASLRPLVEGRETPWRQELFLESLYTGRDTPFQEGLRRGAWKYIRMYDGVTAYREADVDFSGRQPAFEQLFNLTSDPGEMTNLVERMKGDPVLADLRERTRRHSIALNRDRETYRSHMPIVERRSPKPPKKKPAGN